MAGNNYILDTNIIAAWLNGDESIATKIDKANSIFIPSVVAGELFYGAMYSQQVTKNFNKITKLIEAYQVINVDAETAVSYGKIKALLRKKGNPIPENDIWIASLSLQNHLPLVTRDQHFKEIDELKTKKW